MQITQINGTAFTRPNDTTAYASGDLIANSTSAGSVVPVTLRVPYGRNFKIWKVGVLKSTASVTNATFRLHIYKDSPTIANGDNAAWSTTTSGWQGSIDITGTSPTFTDTAQSWGVYVNNSVFAPLVVQTDVDRKLYGLLEARAAYTPGAQETFTLSLVGEAYT